MTEGQVTGQSEQDVEAQCEYAENGKLLKQIGIARTDRRENNRTGQNDCRKAGQQYDVATVH